MLADQDNPLETIAATDPAEPQVVVIYRSRGVPWLLIPPLLLIAVVTAIIVYRKSEPPSPPRPMPSAPATESLAASEVAPTVLPTPSPEPALSPEIEAPKPATEPIPVPDLSTKPTVPETTQPPTAPPSPSPALPEAVAPKAEPTVAPPTEVKPEPVEVAVTPPIEPPHHDPVGFDPEAAKAAAEALIAPKAEAPQVEPKIAAPNRPDTTPPIGGLAHRELSDDVYEDMQRQAEERLAERARLSTQPNPDGRIALSPRNQLIAASRKLAAEDRASFHAELRLLLTKQGNRAGSNIQQLCNRYGRDTLPEIHQNMNRDLVGPSARLSTSGRIQRMRLWGVPETIILDDLVEQAMEDFKNARGGPRSEAEAWVLAARILLNCPPTSKPTANRASRPDGPPARTAVTTPGGS